MAVPASQKALRAIAQRQGILFGGVLGLLICLATIGSFLFSLWRPYFYFPFYIFSLIGLIPLLACACFFFAGLRTGKKTGRVEMGALAGFWAAISLSALGLITLILRTLLSFLPFKGYGYMFPDVLWNMATASLYIGLVYLILALLLGTAIGVLGGFIGKAYANDVPPIPQMPPHIIYPPMEQSQSSSPPPSRNQD